MGARSASAFARADEVWKEDFQKFHYLVSLSLSRCYSWPRGTVLLCRQLQHPFLALQQFVCQRKGLIQGVKLSEKHWFWRAVSCELGAGGVRQAPVLGCSGLAQPHCQVVPYRQSWLRPLSHE